MAWPFVSWVQLIRLLPCWPHADDRKGKGKPSSIRAGAASFSCREDSLHSVEASAFRRDKVRPSFASLL